MKTEPIPAQFSPFSSPAGPYWLGMDTLEDHWEQTKSFAGHEPGSNTFRDFIFWRKISVVWACSTIEAFVNEEGVAWLGQEFYQHNLERLGVLQKIYTLYAPKYRARLPRKDRALRDVLQLFGLRNSIVHPKAREITEDNNRRGGSLPDLHTMEFKHLRNVIRTVSVLFQPCGVGETEA